RRHLLKHHTPLLYCSFYLFGAYLDLHSFPTRRSSDLAALGSLGAIRPRDWWAQREWECRLPAERAPDREAARSSASCDQWRSGSDRKSTRLNSSHVKISYAVFCLKKKITCNVTILSYF